MRAKDNHDQPMANLLDGVLALDKQATDARQEQDGPHIPPYSWHEIVTGYRALTEAETRHLADCTRCQNWKRRWEQAKLDRQDARPERPTARDLNPDLHPFFDFLSPEDGHALQQIAAIVLEPRQEEITMDQNVRQQPPLTLVSEGRRVKDYNLAAGSEHAQTWSFVRRYSRHATDNPEATVTLVPSGFLLTAELEAESPLVVRLAAPVVEVELTPGVRTPLAALEDLNLDYTSSDNDIIDALNRAGFALG